MRFAKVLVSGLLVSGLLRGVVPAQTSSGDLIRTVVQKNRALPAYHQGIEANVQAYEAGLSTHCKDVALNWSQAHATLLRPGKMLPDGQADGTQWQEKVPGSACGESRDYRVLVYLKDGQGGIQPLLPGDGWAGPLLEHDTMVQVIAAATQYTKQQCPVDVVNTRLTGGRPIEQPKAPWTELWTVHSCGKHFGVPITFVPDEVGDGTSMSVRQKEVAPLP